MSFALARRLARVEPFLAMEVTERAMALEREGRSVIRLGVGEPDFPPPPEAVDACARALASGETGYTDSRGLPELREAIADDHARRSGVRVDPGRVLVTHGVSAAMLLVLALLVDEGDEVVLGTPHYPCYPNLVRVFGGRPVLVPTHAEDGFRLDPDAVRHALTPRTRAIVVASPANPTGAVQDEGTMRGLAALGVPLVSDEIYDGLVYDAVRCTTALGLADDVFVLDGFSKRYAMTGFRLGYAIAPAAAARTLQVLQQNLFICANRFVQYAGVAALTRGANRLEAMRIAYARRRALLVDGLRRLGFGVSRMPQGAFYVFADARPFGPTALDSRRFAFDLLERTGVAVAPGVDFGAAGEGFLRFCYAASEDALAEALRRLASALPRP